MPHGPGQAARSYGSVSCVGVWPTPCWSSVALSTCSVPERRWRLAFLTLSMAKLTVSTPTTCSTFEVAICQIGRHPCRSLLFARERTSCRTSLSQLLAQHLVRSGSFGEHVRTRRAFSDLTSDRLTQTALQSSPFGSLLIRRHFHSLKLGERR